MNNNTVSIVKVSNSISSALSEVLTPLGGLASMIHKDDLVLIKPNFVAPRASETGATTNLELVKSIAKEIQKCGGRPMLFEVPAIEQELDTVYGVLKIREFAEENGIEIYTQFKKPKAFGVGEPCEHGCEADVNDIVKVKVPRRLRKLRVPAVTQHAKIINLPKLKTHVITTLSGAMKNLFGFLPESERRKMHIWGIHRAIFDLNKIIKPALTVVDATTCMEGDGPVYGDKVTLNLLIAGTNTVAVDRVCCELVGIGAEDVGYLKIAQQEGEYSKVSVCGEPLHLHAKTFRRPGPSRVYKLWTRLSFALDAVWMKTTGRTLTGMLYSAGIMGTRPYFDWDLCNQCEQCLKVCPVEGALDIQSRLIDYNQCIRCLNCFYVCSLDAISVKGLTKPEAEGGRRKAEGERKK